MTVIHGDCREIIPTLKSEFDACITDPPYGLAFMGRAWDRSDIAFDPNTWRIIMGSLKPGAYLAAFGGTRTFHRMTSAIEDAGFEIRDCLSWLYGTGFPKSYNLAGNRAGWGTALKPAWEPIILARKPLIGSVAANVAAHGTGAINIDACRVECASGDYSSGGTNDLNGTGWGHKNSARTEQHPAGRWPANVLHDGSDEVLGAFVTDEVRREFAADTRTAARFFYSAKASKADRAGSKHPTIKPLALMRWLCTLTIPPGGCVLDPFAGSGTTLQAARECGFKAIGVEQEEIYIADIQRRLKSSNKIAVPLFQ